MEWGTLAATLGGGLIAIAGTVLADRLRTRQEHRRGLRERRREVYAEFIAAAGAAHTELRRLAQDGAGAAGLEAASRAALTDARVYEVRERLFLDASARIAGTGQTMFERLRALRRTVAAGAGVSASAFHDVYHPYLDAVWAYREAVRAELEGPALVPSDFGWSAWDGRERCPHCAGGADGADGTGALPGGRVPEGRVPLPGHARRGDVP
ncbi:CchlQ [Streptomyces sp. NPDC096068]|uniref:CchlQ n=1 Tax=Streptomyces sp. NPDC096068 TaxID=3155424 RepID=UPI003328155E